MSILFNEYQAYTYIYSAINHLNEIIMNRILLFKDLYNQAFNNLGNAMVTFALKALTWLAVGCIGVVLYAIIYRLATGYIF